MMKPPMEPKKSSTQAPWVEVGSGAGCCGAGRNGVVAAGGPRVAAAETSYGEPGAAEGAVLGDRLERVRRAGRVVAADLAVERADQRAVGAEQPDQQQSHVTAPRSRQSPWSRQRSQVGAEFRVRRRGAGRQRPDHEHGRTRKPLQRRQVLPGQVSESALHAVADDGVAHGLAHHETDAAPVVRRRRGRGGPRGCATPQRRPERTVARNASLSTSRWCAGSTAWPEQTPGASLRRPGSCGPCGDARTGSSGRRGCACAGGNRAPCDGGGCSAGTYACSRVCLRCVSGVSTPQPVVACVPTGAGHRRGTALRPAPPTHAQPRWAGSRGHAAPVDTK